MDMMTALRQHLAIALMVATVLGGTSNNNQMINHEDVKNWQCKESVMAAEKEMKCSSVDIKLYEKTKYNLNDRRGIKTNHIIGLVKDEQLYRDKSWDTNDMEPKLTVYDTEGKIIAVVSEESVKFIDIYQGGLLKAMEYHEFGSTDVCCEKK